MCIRDRLIGIYVDRDDLYQSIKEQIDFVNEQIRTFSFLDPNEKLTKDLSCLLYTSDAADERSSVDLGGRRIIKKKTK